MTAPNENENVEDQTTEEPEVAEEDNTSTEEKELSVDDYKKLLAERDASLKKANTERTAAQRKYKELRDASKDANDPPALSDAAKKALVVTALKAEGLNASQASKLAKLYDLEDVDVDGDEVVGIDFTSLREDFPQLFEKPSADKTNKATPLRNIDKGDKKNERAASAEEQFANALLRK